MSLLIQHREQQHLTQEELAKKAGVSVRTVQRIEAGAKLKGHTLKVLATALGVKEEDLVENMGSDQKINPQLVKFINLSSLPLVIVPLANIIAPLLIVYLKKEVNSLTKQIVSIQIMWTILSFLLFMMSVFLKKWLLLGNQIELITLLILIVLNVFIIIRNTAEIDKNNALYFKLNFSFL